MCHQMARSCSRQLNQQMLIQKEVTKMLVMVINSELKDRNDTISFSSWFSHNQSKDATNLKNVKELELCRPRTPLKGQFDCTGYFLLVFSVIKVQIKRGEKVFRMVTIYCHNNCFILRMTDRKKLKSIEVIVNDDVHKKR